ncbi:MAG: aspartyl/asparaginyl beta-hydroxylase domain-containing protein, partial [Bacteroidetes bacterium]|nr:aspartyl/asparaginyl beta-hydroxylase domain-containing protein [Bacteroidota bacterium]
VPKNGECFIINGGQKYSWKEGEDILFDDTFRHQVSNNTNETRAILFCDVYRTDFAAVFRWLNNWVYAMRVKSNRLKTAVKKAKVN